MNKRIFVLVGIGIMLLLGYLGACKYSANNLPSSYEKLVGNEKKITNQNNYQEGTLSYGPYLNVKAGKVLVAVKYKADSCGNNMDIVSTSANKTYYAGELSTTKRWKICVVDIERVNDLEVRTFYGGNGELEVYTYYIVQIWFIACIAVLMLVMSVGFYLLKNAEKIYVYIIGGIILFFIKLFSVRATVMASYLVLLPLFFSLKKFGKEERVLGMSSMIAFFWLEYFNYEFYKNVQVANMKSSVFSFLIFFEVCFIVFFIIKEYRWKRFVFGGVTALVLIYSSAQYIYFSLFGNFFKLKAVRLLSTAAGATSSITELLASYGSKCFLLNTLLFIVLYICLCILLQNQKVQNTVYAKSKLLGEYIMARAGLYCSKGVKLVGDIVNRLKTEKKE